MQGHSDILDSAICALYEDKPEHYHQIIQELRRLHAGPVETFDRWLRRKISECITGLEGTIQFTKDPARVTELRRQADLLREHLKVFAAETAVV